MLIAWVLLATSLLAAPLRAQETAPRELRFGIMTPIQNTTWDDLVATWKEAEALGFHSAWINDHFIPTHADEDGPGLESWTTLAALAAETSRLRIGVLVTGNTYRNPALVAKMATTLDHISNGRLILGMGAGWFEREHEAYGFAFGTAKERARKLEEALQVITKLWSEDHPSFTGTYYSLERAPYAPANMQKPRPPIVIGGQGKKWIVPLVARYGDGWNAPFGVSPDGIRERRQIIEAECERIGRTPCPKEVSAMLVLVAITRIPLAGPVVRLAARAIVEKKAAALILAGSPAAIRDRIREYVDAGVNEIIVTLRPPFNRKRMRRFAEKIIPQVREGR